MLVPAGEDRPQVQMNGAVDFRPNDGVRPLTQLGHERGRIAGRGADGDNPRRGGKRQITCAAPSRFGRAGFCGRDEGTRRTQRGKPLGPLLQVCKRR